VAFPDMLKLFIKTGLSVPQIRANVLQVLLPTPRFVLSTGELKITIATRYFTASFFYGDRIYKLKKAILISPLHSS
jgi:hypothetical protein